MSSSDGEPIKFDSVELLSLYTTVILKRLTTIVQPVEDCLSELIRVLEHNLNNMKVDKKWFFGTLRDHARLFNHEWKLNNVDGPDRGIIAYDTLLLVIILRLGLEKLWMTGGVTQVHNGMLMEELAALYHPEKPTLSLKYLSQCHGLFDYLSSHSPGLEELYVPRSHVTTFQNCMKFKNLRVLELGGRISDKALCHGLWNINKKSEKVLEMALKESKGLDSWLLSLPHLEVLRNNFLDQHTTNTMRVSLGAAALLIQPKMETVEAVTSWNTATAIMHLLDTEGKIKNYNMDSREFKLTKLGITYSESIDDEWLRRLFRACPKLTELYLLDSEVVLSHLVVVVEMIHALPLKKLELDTLNMKRLDVIEMFKATASLTDLVLYTSLLDLASYRRLRTSSHSGEVPSMPRNLLSLSLNFALNGIDPEEEETLLWMEDSKNVMKSFLSNFGAVNRINFFNTLFLPGSHLVFGCIWAALEEMKNLKHLTVISCNSWEDTQPDEHSDASCLYRSPYYIQAHASEVRRLLPHLQKRATFQSMCRLESFELDALYLSPRVDRMVAALRASGVLVNIFYSSKMHHSCEYSFNKTNKK